MRSYLVGARLIWTLNANSEGATLGPLSRFRLLLKADWLHTEFPNFRYGQAPVPNRNALVATFGLEFTF